MLFSMALKKTKMLHFKSIRIPKKILEKWAGKTGATVEGKVVAGGSNTQEAIKNAKKLYPKIKEWKIGILSIPPKEGYWVLKLDLWKRLK